MIVDTSFLLAYFVAAEPDHLDATRVMDATPRHLIVSPYVVAELDYILTDRRGTVAELDALREIAGGAWELAQFGSADLAEAIDVVERYRDQNIGVTDASIVVLAKRYDTRTIATLDRRHFEVLRPLQGGRFEIVP